MPLIVSTRFSPDTLLSAVSPAVAEKLTIPATYNLIYNATLMVEQGMGAALAIEHLVHITPESPYAFIPLSPVTTMRTVFAWKNIKSSQKPKKFFLMNSLPCWKNKIMGSRR